MFKQPIREALILIAAAVVVALVAYAVRPDRPDWRSSPAGQTPAAPVEQDGLAAQISLEEARRLFEAGGSIFVDARHRADFDAGHIEGAVHLYAMASESWLAGFLQSTAPDIPIVSYCDGEDCRLASDLAELLVLNGFTNVRYLKNGWSRWQQNGLPMTGGVGG